MVERAAGDPRRMRLQTRRPRAFRPAAGHSPPCSGRWHIWAAAHEGRGSREGDRQGHRAIMAPLGAGRAIIALIAPSASSGS